MYIDVICHRWRITFDLSYEFIVEEQKYEKCEAFYQIMPGVQVPTNDSAFIYHVNKFTYYSYIAIYIAYYSYNVVAIETNMTNLVKNDRSISGRIL